jgi:hypothetical protein
MSGEEGTLDQNEASSAQKQNGCKKLGPGDEVTDRDHTWHLDSNDFRIFGFNSPLIYSEEARMPVPLHFTYNMYISRIICTFHV